MMDETFRVTSFVTLNKMSYDTEHVRNVGDTPEMITGLPTFTELLTNTNLASLYTAIRHSSGVTASDLVEQADVSKKTVYEYLQKLEQAGLVIDTSDETGPSTYEPEAFQMTLTVRDIEVSITPELIAVVAREDEYPVLGRVRDDDGLVTFALAHDLVKAHSEGDITTRQIATLTGLSPGTTYDFVQALYEIHDYGDDDTSPETYTPDNVTDDELL